MNLREEDLRLLSRGLDDELSSEEHVRLREELARNPELKQTQDLLRGISQSVRQGPPRTSPVGLADRIVAHVAQHAEDSIGARGSREASALVASDTPTRSSGGVLLSWLQRSASLAAAVLLLCGVLYVAQLPDKALADPDTPAIDFQPTEEFVEIMEELNRLGISQDELGLLKLRRAGRSGESP